MGRSEISKDGPRHIPQLVKKRQMGVHHWKWKKINITSIVANLIQLIMDKLLFK